MLVDLDKDGMPEALAALTLTEVVASLKEKNQQYAALTEQRTNAQADNPVESAKKIRLRMDEEYDEMTTYAFAQSVVKPTPSTTNASHKRGPPPPRSKRIANRRQRYKAVRPSCFLDLRMMGLPSLQGGDAPLINDY